jgi:hypothetical protein
MSRQPLRYLQHPVALLAFIAAAQAFVAGANVRGIVAAALGILFAAATEASRTRVTPVAGASRASRLRQAAAREDGQGLVEVLLFVFLVLVILVVLLRFL